MTKLLYYAAGVYFFFALVSLLSSAILAMHGHDMNALTSAVYSLVDIGLAVFFLIAYGLTRL
jgi:hypothetical protein